MNYRADIIHAAQPLRRIFWGALLVLLDVTFSWTVNGEGVRIDLLSDTVGLLLITAAVARLRNTGMNLFYAPRMAFIHWVSIFLLLQSVVQHVIFEAPWVPPFLPFVLELATVAAVLWFCTCMRDVCRETTLDDAARSWNRTLVRFLACYGIPYGLLLIVGLVATMTGQPLDPIVASMIGQPLDPGLAVVLIGVLFFVPLVSFFRATSTMARSAEEISAFAVQATAGRAAALR